MIWKKIRDFFKQIFQTTVDGLGLYILNRNREEVLKKEFHIWYIFVYGAIIGSIRVLLQVALQVVVGFFQLTREIFMNMIIFPFFITVFASVLLTLSARGLGGKGNFRSIVNYIFYANTFHLIVPFFDFIFNKLLGLPFVFDFGLWGGWDPYNPWHSLFYDKLVGLSAGIIFMYVLLIIRTPGVVRWNFDLNLKRTILATCSLLLMFWIIFIAWPFWYFWVPRYIPLPTGADGYTLVFTICTLIAFPYFWKNLRQEGQEKLHSTEELTGKNNST